MRLKDKVAIITGGSRGIGFATAEKFLAEGATVIITASSQQSADKAVAKLREKYMQNPPAGYTRREIERMRDNDILDMDYFLNEF